MFELCGFDKSERLPWPLLVFTVPGEFPLKTAQTALYRGRRVPWAHRVTSESFNLDYEESPEPSEFGLKLPKQSRVSDPKGELQMLIG